MAKRRLTQTGSLPQTIPPLDGDSELPESSPSDHVPYASLEASTSNVVATTEDPDEETEIIVIESSDTPGGRDEAESSTTPNPQSLVNPKRKRKSNKKYRKRHQQNARVADNAQQPILRTPPRSNQPPVPQSPPPLLRRPRQRPTCRPPSPSPLLSEPLSSASSSPEPIRDRLRPRPLSFLPWPQRPERRSADQPPRQLSQGRLSQEPLTHLPLPRELFLREPAQEPEQQQLSQQPLHEPAQESTAVPVHESVQLLTQQTPETLVRSQAGHDEEVGCTETCSLEQTPTLRRTNQSPGKNELLSLPRPHKLHEFSTKKRTPLDYKPRRALVHLFANMDSETVLLHGGNKLEFWNPVSNSLIGKWSGESKGVGIGQVQPLSSSILAIVSSVTGKNEQVSKAGRLFFMNASWSAEDSQFADLPIQQWTSDVPSEDISVVEGIDLDGIDDDSQVSIFTGDTSGGGVYRRIFDVCESAVTKVNQVSMINRHHGIVSALCHIQAQGRLVSGTTSGTICLNDHDSGKIVQEFNLGMGNVVSSITRCPINSHLFMVGCSQPEYKLRIFDTREKLLGKKPSLTLQDAGSTATSSNNYPSWDYNTAMIFAPVRKKILNKPTAVINYWDPRYNKCSTAEHCIIHPDENEVYSVAFTKPAKAKDRLIITASQDSLGMTSFRQVWT